MAYIFLDESGDLGFDSSKKKSSKFFIITCLFTSRKGSLEKIVKKIFQSFPEKQRKQHSGSLHASKEHPKTRVKVLSLLNLKEDISILTIYLNKRKVYTHLQDEKHVLYNYVTNILLDRIYSKKIVSTKDPIHLIASRRETNKYLNENFQNYLIGQIDQRHKMKITIEIKTPHAEKCLQLTDFVSWAIFRKIEFEDDSYYNLIKSKIVEENPLFP